MNEELTAKKEALAARLKSIRRLAVAFSGGVDSALLLSAASRALPAEDILALTARSVFFPKRESHEADGLAAELGLTHLNLDLDVLACAQVADNPPDRCYHCKRLIFQELAKAAAGRGFPVLADGSNLDDLDDYRPGARAIAELGVLSPLREAGLRKSEIRALSAAWGLSTWNKPAFACLASRFPYGRPLRPEALAQVERAEDFLLSRGFRQIRVRHHGEVARLEVAPEERARFFDLDFMDQVQSALSALGFPFVALDLGGYRGGALNQALDRETPMSARPKVRR